MRKDPVCGMTVNPQHSTISLLYKGQMYYFCSSLCKSMFERAPAKYVKSVEAVSEQDKPLLLLGGGETWQNKLMK
ncbi:MAG: YHS domain-containing protein [Anaerolineales bacterium]